MTVIYKCNMHFLRALSVLMIPVSLITRLQLASCTDQINSLGSCVATIATENFLIDRLLLVDSVVHSNVTMDSRRELIWNKIRRRTTDNESLRVILKELHNIAKWPIMIQATEGRDWQLKAASYILETSDELLDSQLERLRNSSTWNSRAKFLVIATSFTAEQTHVTKRIFEKLSSFKIVNVVVLVTSPSNSFDLYSWFPYQRANDCGGAVNEITLLDRWTHNGTSKSFKFGAQLYGTRIPNNLHGCWVNVSAFHWPPFVYDLNVSDGKHEPKYEGLEIQIVNTMVTAMGADLHFLPSENVLRWGFAYGNVNPAGSLGNVYLEKAHISVGSHISYIHRFKYFDISQYYMTNGVVWMVPRAQRVARWRSLTKIFSGGFWSVVLLTLVLSSLVIWLVARHRLTDPRMYKNLAISFLYGLSMLLGVSVSSHPRSWLLRFFFLTYAFYCLQINTAYQSSLVSVLTDPGYEKQIASNEDLVSSKVEFGAVHSYEIHLSKDNPDEAEILRRLGDYCSDILSCLRRVAKGNFAFISDRALSVFLVSSWEKDRYGNSIVKTFPSDLFTYYVGFLVKKDSILLNRFNVVIDRVNEAGLMGKWEKDVNKLSQFASEYVGSKSSLIGPFRLSLGHLQGAFLIFAIGMLTSGVVFVVENGVAWLLKNSNDFKFSRNRGGNFLNVHYEGWMD